MKTLPALCIAVLIFSGCSSLPGDLRKNIPNGSWESIELTITGKFSATKIVGAGVVKDGDSITAKELHIRHSNAWVPLIEVNAVGYAPTPGTAVMAGPGAARQSIY
jgi:hypothetical protein